MSRKYHSYSLEITDEPFLSSNGEMKQTAHVKFLNRNQKVVFTEKYGVADLNDIYEQLHSKKTLHLDNCYIKNFSLTDFRLKYNLQKITLIEIAAFSSINAFYDSDDETDFSHAEFNGIALDFVNTHFASGNVTFYKSKIDDIDVDFSNVNFGNENINFQFTEFGTGSISFENALFGDGDLTFVNTNFGNGKVNFKNTDFGNGTIDFHFSKFGNGDISFDKAVFGGSKVDFRRVEFGDGKLDFTRTNFGDGEINFEETEGGKGKKNFKKAIFGNASVSFAMADFKDDLIFENSEFKGGKISFLNAKLKGLSFKGCQLNNYLDLRVESCEKLDLSDSVIKDIIDLKPGFSKVQIGELNLAGARNLGKIFIDWRENHVYRLIAFQKDTSNLQKAEQFRILKEDFNTSGQYNDEDEAYVEFKRFELKHQQEKRLKKHPNKKWIIYPSIFFQKLIFDRMGLYATSPLRVFISMIVVYLFYSFIYLILPYISDTEIQTGLSNPEPLSDFAQSMYFSAITFFTIGYGDYFPYGYIRWVACAEGFSGVFMMAYFVVAFVRKMLR